MLQNVWVESKGPVDTWLWCRCFKCVLLSLWCLGRKVFGNCIDSSPLPSFLFKAVNTSLYKNSTLRRLNGRLLIKKRICCLWKQFLSFMSNSHFIALSSTTIANTTSQWGLLIKVRLYFLRNEILFLRNHTPPKPPPLLPLPPRPPPFHSYIGFQILQGNFPSANVISLWHMLTNDLRISIHLKSHAKSRQWLVCGIFISLTDIFCRIGTIMNSNSYRSNWSSSPYVLQWYYNILGPVVQN